MLSVYFTLGTSIYYQVVLFHPPHPGFGSRYSNPYMPLTFSCILKATAHFLVLGSCLQFAFYSSQGTTIITDMSFATMRGFLIQ